MSNIYNILAKIPALDAGDMYITQEKLAQKLIHSGLLRISAEDRHNFVLYSRPHEQISMMFSHRELRDEALIPKTRKIIKNTLKKHRKFKNKADATVEKEVEQDWQRLLKKDEMNIPIEEGHEEKLARAFIQSAHTAVISLLLEEGVEVFISYSHSISDMLDIKNWQKAGNNNGMQSTDGKDCAIYVSCGGNPFIAPEDIKNQNDGLAALSRLMVIAAQELGHYADIIRDGKNRQYDRHSTNFSMTLAKENVQKARLLDLHNMKTIKENLNKTNLAEIVEMERKLKFYEKHEIINSKVKSLERESIKKLHSLINKYAKNNLKFIAKLPYKIYVASHIKMAVDDMRFNLSPIADSYFHDNPKAEEAIVCAEALARVPQQVMKWGHPVTRACMPNLYQIYYGEITPRCIRDYEQISGKKYQMKFTKPGISTTLGISGIIEKIFKNNDPR